MASGRYSNSIRSDVNKIAQNWATTAPTEVKKTYVVQEREVSYRFTLHQHPYVGNLTRRLLNGGVAGLQAADTDYDGRAARPDSVLFEMGADPVTLPRDTRLALIQATTVTAAGGAPFDLAAGMSVTLAAVGPTAVQAHTLPPVGGAPPAVPRLRARLLGGLPEVPARGATLRLATGSLALVQGNTLVKLNAATQVRLTDGSVVGLPIDTPLALADGATLTLPTAIDVTVVRARRLPKLYAPALAGYAPTTLVEQPHPACDLDFTFDGAYGGYNWELFYHAPLMIAMHLSKNGRYAEAQRWFHFLFDPTDTSEEPSPDRFWKVQPFHTADVRKIEEILVNLVTEADPDLRDETIRSVNAWKAAPFRPHAVARIRQQAYMFKTVMAYLDNLIAWGDSLFRQDTGEAIDEAMMLYVLARNILGPRPLPVPPKGSVRPQTYANLREDLRHFGTVLRNMEAAAPFDLTPLPADTSDGSGLATVRSLGRALYFSVPVNDKLLGYWDTVDDRLFKIRNSLNIQGAFRQLALFEPPIDPALLARAAAAGLDVAAIVNGLNQPLPLVRFQLLAQKAAEIVQEVKSLGNNLLSAIEKEDGEAMAILRARHERAILEMVEHVRYAQWQEAIKAREGLLESLQLAMQRYAYYELQLGKTFEEIKNAVPALVDLDVSGLEKMRLDATEGRVSVRDIEIDIATDAFAQAAQFLSGGKLLSSHEVRESLFLEGAQLASDIANILNTIGSAIHVVPEFKIHGQPMGVGGTAETGGSHFGWGIEATANAAKAVAERLNFEARRAARIDGFARRERDWAFQSNLAAGEINQVLKQLRAAQIREAIAEMELNNHRKQIANAQDIEYFLTGEKNPDWTQKSETKEKKVTNKAFYAWMKREVKGLYAQCFQFAFDVAKKAERALQHELGDPSLSYIQFGYLAGKEGLLAGEKLYLDVKRMEMAYLELNRREYELTKHISLLQVDPAALLRLRATGRCTVRLPEALFDMDGPGHYFRRIKTVALSIPCVTGPYASVNCTLRLLKSSIRTTAVVGDEYARQVDGEDGRFNDYFGSLQAIVTSSAQNDSGLFETNLRDERYLPFENSGVIGEWQLQLPGNPSAGDPTQFDYDTISDVILHMRYTAREGGDILRNAALTELTTLIDSAHAAGSVRLFSLRHEFPSAWAAYKASTSAGGLAPLSITLTPQHFPFWSKPRPGQTRRVHAAELVVAARGPVTLAAPGGAADPLGAWTGNLRRTPITNAPMPVFDGTNPSTWDVRLTQAGVTDAWLLVNWGAPAA